MHFLNINGKSKRVEVSQKKQALSCKSLIMGVLANLSVSCVETEIIRSNLV